MSYNYNKNIAAWDQAEFYQLIKDVLSTKKIGNNNIFELGCGNGVLANQINKLGYKVTAVDTSESGINMAQSANSGIDFQTCSPDEELWLKYGVFPVVLSIEVIEHVYSPHHLAKNIFNLTSENGLAIISTPYHGLIKNLAIILSGQFDSHFNPLWEGGHIKFWSKTTLKKLLLEAGFKSVEFKTIGRLPLIAKSMVAIASK